MAGKKNVFGKIKVARDGVNVQLDLTRFNANFQRAQYYLDGQVMTDMVPLMPFVNGNFIQETRAASATLQGTGAVIAGIGPHGQFLYGGKVMVDEVTGSAWARKGARKAVTEQDLTYSNPQAVPHWFEEAKKRHAQEWVKGVKKYAGGEQE